MPKKIILLTLFIILCQLTHAQLSWMTGTWKSTSATTTPSANAANTIRINDVSGESFTGTKTSEITDGPHAKITIAISGSFKARGLYLQNGEVLQKEPASRQWDDCSACTETNKMIIKRDSLILIDSISGCDNRCDAITFYYRLLSEYDDDTQRYLVDRFGRPADIIGFHPYQQQKENTIADDDNKPIKNDVVAVTTVDNSNAEAIKNKEKSRRDSLDNIARIKQQQINDAARLVQQKKRQQQINDSLDLVQQKEQRRLKDSSDNVARLEKIRLQTEDSLQNIQVKIRQQAVADSLNLVNHRKQQYINDSLQSAAAANLQKQRTADSLIEVQARDRQEEADSLAALRKQAYADSLQKAALAKAVPPITDSNESAADKALTSRASVLLHTYHITSPDILIELFDNGEIDSDRVSVYHNNAVIVSNQMLGIKPITLNIHADAANREHEFVLVAENLGSIPPNSALMRITAGKQVYKLSVNTDMKTNARILFYYDGN